MKITILTFLLIIIFSLNIFSNDIIVGPIKVIKTINKDSIALALKHKNNLIVLDSIYKKISKLDLRIKSLREENQAKSNINKYISENQKKIKLAIIRIKDKIKREKQVRKFNLEIIEKRKTLEYIKTIPKLLHKDYIKISKLLEKFSNSDDSFYYDSKTSEVGIFFSNDSTLKVYSWNSVNNDHESIFKTIIQHKKNDSTIVSYYLTDKNNLDISDSLTYTSKNWRGALYYNAITSPQPNTYLLISWRPSINSLTQNKYIETLKIQNDSLIFGVNIIKKEKKLYNKREITFHKRLSFIYSAGVNMSITYNKKHDVITFDHLNVSSPNLIGKYEFYGPDLSYDALVLDNKYWKFIEDFNIDKIIIQPKDILKIKAPY